MELVGTSKALARKTEDLPTVKVIYNPKYSSNKIKIDLVYTAYENLFKEKFHLYLPVPAGLEVEEVALNEAILKATGQIVTELAVGSGWSAASKSYVNEAFESFLTQQTVSIAISLALQHPPVIKLPTRIDYLEKRMTADGKDAEQFLKDVLIANSLSGRVPLLLDISSEKKFHIVQYAANSLIDWADKSVATDTREIVYLKFIDFEKNENYDPLRDDDSKRFIKVMFYHYMKGEGKSAVYTVEKYKSKNSTFNQDDLYLDDTATPKYMGKTLNFIPGVIIGSLNNTVDVDPIPLYSIANCDLKRVELSAMLGYAQKMSSGPTMYMTGVDKEDAPPVTGPGSLITLADSQARVGYTTTDTTAFMSLREEMQEYVAIAQELGASILGAKRGSSESGEALRLRQAAATASLKSIVDNTGAGIELLLQMAAKWSNSDIEEVTFEANKEFSTFALTANETIALIQSWQSTAISQSTLLENFRKAGMLQAGETVEDELARLEEDGEKYVAPVDPNVNVNKTVTDELDVGNTLPDSTTMNKNIKS